MRPFIAATGRSSRFHRSRRNRGDKLGRKKHASPIDHLSGNEACPPNAKISLSFNRIAIRLGIVCAATAVAACGGGEPEGIASASALDAASLSLTPVLHAYCDVTTPIQTPKPGESGYDYAP